MIDIGLLASIAVVVIVPTFFVQPWPLAGAPTGLIDAGLGAVVVGLVVGRITAVALDDPGSLTTLSDLMIIRSGVEFWPGVGAAVLWIVFRSHREGVAASLRLAAIAAPALVAWACYEATCVLRDGCPGPVSAIGLRPDGLVKRMIPIGLLAAAAAAAAALMVRRAQRAGMTDIRVVTLTVAAAAAIRSVDSIWLPRIGTGFTRQHQTSLLVAVLSALTFAVLTATGQRPSAQADQ